MKTYEIIYPFELLDLIQEGKLVYLLDRYEQVVLCVNDITVDKLAEVLKNGKTDKKRYEFWIEEVEETEEIEENEDEE